MKLVLREYGTGRLYVRKVNSALDVLGEDVVGFYPDEDLLAMTMDADLLKAIHRRLAKIGGPDHPIVAPRIDGDQFSIQPKRKVAPPPPDKDGFRFLSREWFRSFFGR